MEVVIPHFTPAPRVSPEEERYTIVPIHSVLTGRVIGTCRVEAQHPQVYREDVCDFMLIFIGIAIIAVGIAVFTPSRSR